MRGTETSRLARHPVREARVRETQPAGPDGHPGQKPARSSEKRPSAATSHQPAHGLRVPRPAGGSAWDGPKLSSDVSSAGSELAKFEAPGRRPTRGGQLDRVPCAAGQGYPSRAVLGPGQADRELPEIRLSFIRACNFGRRNIILLCNLGRRHARLHRYAASSGCIDRAGSTR